MTRFSFKQKYARAKPAALRMRHRKSSIIAHGISAFLCLFPFIAYAQTSRPPAPRYSLMQLRFSPLHSAARAAGMGGAFLGVANDATTAALNPAGLAFLARPEISLSQAAGWNAREFPAGVNSNRRESSMAFNGTLVNLVYPFKGFTFALYHQLAFRAQYDFEREQFLTIAASRPPTLHEQLGAAGNFAGLRSEFALEVWHDALVIAKTLHRRVRLGATLRTTQLRLRLNEQHYFSRALWQQSQYRAGAVGPNYAEDLYRIYSAQREEFRPSWNFGALFELHKNFTLGMVYQHLPAFMIENRVFLPAYQLADRDPNDGRDEALAFPAEEVRADFELNLPDQFGFGAAVRLANQTLLAFDLVWHRSKNLLRKLDANLPQDDVLGNEGVYVDPDERADIATQSLLAFHGGLEHVFFFSRTRMPVRCGFYSKPEFGLRAQSSEPNLQREYPARAKRLHVTAGAGLIIKNFRFETSLDYAKHSATAIGSAVVSF